MLGLDLDSWNGLMLISLAFAAVAACAVGLTTFSVVKLQKAAEEEAKYNFEAYKLEAAQTIAESRKETAEANARAIEAKLELAKFREPRRLSAEGRKIINDFVKDLPAPFALISSNGAEPLDFALDIGAALKESGWSWRDFPNGVQPVGGRPSVGLSILDHLEVQTTKSHEASALVLLEALKAIGAPDVRRGPDASDRPGMDGPFVFIFVGGKR
jgi:hypothetical protein